MVVVMPHHRKATSAVKGVRVFNHVPYAASIECGPYAPRPIPLHIVDEEPAPLPVAIVVRKPDSSYVRALAVIVGMCSIAAALVLAMAGAGCAGVGL